MKIGKYKLQNTEKIDRAINGNPTSAGLVGGVADENGKYKDEDLLVQYDKIGGYITNLKGDKIKNGSFYDIKNKKAFDKPQIIYIFNIPGSGTIEVKDGEEAPKILEAMKVVEEQKTEARKKKKSKKGK